MDPEFRGCAQGRVLAECVGIVWTGLFDSEPRLFEHRIGHVEAGHLPLRPNLECSKRRIGASAGAQLQHPLSFTQRLEVEVIPDARIGLDRSGGDLVQKPGSATSVYMPEMYAGSSRSKIRPSLYTLHTYYFAKTHIANRGPERAMYISRMRDAIDARLRLTNHTDLVVETIKDGETIYHRATSRRPVETATPATNPTRLASSRLSVVSAVSAWPVPAETHTDVLPRLTRA